LELEIAWAERKTQQLVSLDDIQRGYSASSFYDQRHFTNASELLQKVTTDHRYLLAIAISGHYFENWPRAIKGTPEARRTGRVRASDRSTPLRTMASAAASRRFPIPASAGNA
jgi:hypothetical protein